MAEAVKYGMIKDRSLFELLERGEFERHAQEVVTTCVRIKAEIVGRDEFDNGERQLLNFGHTPAHAIEKLSAFDISHGHAVAMGMRLMTRAAESAGMLTEPASARLENALAINNLPTSCPYGAAELAQAAAGDKKRSGDSIRVVVPLSIGNSALHTIPVEELRAFFERGLGTVVNAVDIRITPRALNGELDAVESKSDAHRQLIAASLSRTPTKLRVRAVSKDIAATIACLRQAGARIVPGADGRLHITPLWAASAVNPVFDCGESGSTLRFLLPVAAAVFNGFTLTGSGRLPQRPLAPIVEAMAHNGCSFSGAALPMTVTGHLSGGVYELPGDISSQFVSGLLLALPLVDGDSEIVLTTPLESTGYVDMTLATLAAFPLRSRAPRGGTLCPARRPMRPRGIRSLRAIGRTPRFGLRPRLSAAKLR